jgi:hypothetical protein
MSGDRERERGKKRRSVNIDIDFSADDHNRSEKVGPKESTHREPCLPLRSLDLGSIVIVDFHPGRVCTFDRFLKLGDLPLDQLTQE